ncbi:MAG: hypothetical protein ISN26_07465 [Betaproteobacteria bacterium AqS2]|uniref:Uncharacterized protein n=1 Tax=Candidatus Amphirhobacter heronislandensis TaxID=1732024 RepID=A0A930UHR1_9GAMM|nr:hypothetical protein [Betaproteobacteria bacterium AqS2]
MEAAKTAPDADADLGALLAKVRRIKKACAELQARNRELRHELGARDAAIADLKRRVAEQDELRRKARARLERLASQLPG